MPDPAIRKALEEAELALHSTADYQPENDRLPPEMQREVIANPQEVAAAVAAAFLRALPACDVMMERNSWEGGPHSTHTLAAAVEAAAKEEG